MQYEKYIIFKFDKNSTNKLIIVYFKYCVLHDNIVIFYCLKIKVENV